MEKYTVMAEGKDRLDVMNRISTLYLQKRVQVESFEYSRTAPEQGAYKITCYSERKDVIDRIVNQINNIVEIRRAYYAY
jgi:acetolactate synthase small subunit